jgi:hypothetical protein
VKAVSSPSPARAESASAPIESCRVHSLSQRVAARSLDVSLTIH